MNRFFFILLFLSFIITPAMAQNSGQVKGVSKTTPLPNGGVNYTTTFENPGLNVKVSTSVSKENKESYDAVEKKLGAAFNNNCAAFKSQTPHPLMSGFTVLHEVQGKKDGKCIYTQTMPNNGLMTCSYGDAELAQIRKSGWDPQKMMGEKNCIISGY